MSRAAYDARRNNLRKRRTEHLRTYDQSRCLELEIALATHRGESYRAMANRLGCSHVYCWKVARAYRRGGIPMLAPDEQGLSALRNSLDHDPATERHAASRDAGVPAQFAKVSWAWTRQWCSRDEIWGCMLLTQEQKTMLDAEFDRRRLGPPGAQPATAQRRAAPLEPPAIPERYRDLNKWKEQYYAKRPWLRKLRSD